MAQNGPTPRVIVGNNDIADGSVTAAKIESGYNLLTDAEKVQSLVGSSIVNFLAAKVRIASDTDLGAYPLQVFGDPYFYNAGDLTLRLRNLAGGDSQILFLSGTTKKFQVGYDFVTGASDSFRIYSYGDGATIARFKAGGIVNIVTPTFADNAAATAGGLLAGDIYKTPTGTLMIRY